MALDARSWKTSKNTTSWIRNGDLLITTLGGSPHMGLTLSLTYGSLVWQGYNSFRVLFWWDPIKWPVQLGNYLNVHILQYLSINLNCWGRWFFMYNTFIINEQVVCCKIDIPCDYLPHLAKSSWLSNQGQTLAHFKKHLKRESRWFITMRLNLKAISKLHNTK